MQTNAITNRNRYLQIHMQRHPELFMPRERPFIETLPERVVMSEEEIIYRYNHSEHLARQIQILADLNDVSKQTIRAIIEHNRHHLGGGENHQQYRH